MPQTFSYTTNGSTPTPDPGHSEGLKIDRSYNAGATPHKIDGKRGPDTTDENVTVDRSWHATTTAGAGFHG